MGILPSCCLELSVYRKQQRCLQRHDNRQAQTELPLARLVPEYHHAGIRTYAAAQNGYPEKSAFRDTPSPCLGTVLIESIEQESNDIY